MTSHLWQPYYIWPRSGNQCVDLSGLWALQPSDVPRDEPAQSDAWANVARVPQTVHWSLHAAGALPHPYFHRNIKQYAWVEKQSWYYRRIFATPNVHADGYVFLCFDGVDYFSRFWLNGELLGRHEGMFGGPMIEVSRLLRRDRPNELIVEVQAGSFGQTPDWDARTNKGRVVKPWGISRGSSAEDYMSVGIWRPVRLEVVSAAHLERPFLKTRQLAADRAELELSVEVMCGAHSGQFDLNPWVNYQLSHVRYDGVEWVRSAPEEQARIPWPEPLSLRIEIEGGFRIFDRTIPLNPLTGRNWVRQPITIERPRLWWPVGLGEPNLYHVSLSLLAGDGQVLDRLAFDTGIRTVETRPTPGPQTGDRWGDWQFIVNGRPFFVKGINWMPADQLLDLPADLYRWLLEMARAAGIQMIRIWGGGLVETDDFYRICDELGLLVWQDFPIGNGDSPDWPLDVWQAQVAMNVFRLRNHPSLAVWCGGNEFNPYSIGNTAVIGVFERCVQLLDGTRIIRRTSPDEGSIHTYPDMDPTWYGRCFVQVPFVAETGIHSFPEAGLLRELCDEQEFSQPLSGIFESRFVDAHPDLRQHFVEYSPQRIPRMISRASHIEDVTAPTLETLVEASQIGAGEFYQLFSEALQANYPVTAGLLPWVYKRPWPNIGIQLVDGMGHAGASYYFLKRTYEPLHVMVALPHLLWAPGESLPLPVRILNLTAGPEQTGTVSVVVFDAAFRRLREASAPITIPAAPAVAEADLGSFEIPPSLADSFFFVVAELRAGDGARLSRQVYWPRCLRSLADSDIRARDRAAPQPWPLLNQGPWLKRQIAACPTRLELAVLQRATDALTLAVRNAGDVPALPVRLDITRAKRAFYASDSFFWLAPGERREIALRVLWREPPAWESLHVVASAWNAAEVRTQF